MVDVIFFFFYAILGTLHHIKKTDNKQTNKKEKKSLDAEFLTSHF